MAKKRRDDTMPDLFGDVSAGAASTAHRVGTLAWALESVPWSEFAMPDGSRIRHATSGLCPIEHLYGATDRMRGAYWLAIDGGMSPDDANILLCAADAVESNTRAMVVRRTILKQMGGQ